MNGLVPMFFIACALYVLLPIVVILSMRPLERPKITPAEWKRLPAPPKEFIEGEFTVVKEPQPRKRKEPAMSKRAYN